MSLLPTPDLLERWTSFYEDAHAHPELGHAEFRTTDNIERELDRLGVENFRVCGTGTVGVLRNGAGPTIAFRADIDGLPVVEQTNLPYASRATGEYKGEQVGVMHACGHDTHFSALLGTVEHLLAHRDAWAGTLVLIFQPAEESGDGADRMVAGGLWDRAPRPEVLLGQHVGPAPAGMFALRAGHLMSLTDTLQVTVHGQQAHGSQPQDAVDPIVAAASLVGRLQTVVSREVAPGAGVVVTVGTIRGGTAPNIIPETCELTINIRTPDEATREPVVAAVRRIMQAEALASRTRVEVDSMDSFSRCFNDPEETEKVIGALRGAFSEEAVILMPSAATASEDVGVLADSIGIPLVYWFFGAAPMEAFADGMPPINHSPHFAPDGALAMDTGIRAATAVILSYLGR